MFDINVRLKELEKDIGPLKTDVAELLAHRKECDNLHNANSEYHKRSDDAIKQNTESNILLAKALVGMNATVTEAVKTITNDRPAIKLVEKVQTWASVNGWIWVKIIIIVTGVTAIITLIKLL